MSGETAAAASADVEANMNFTSVNDTVTAKEYVRLRNKPSQDTDSTIIATLVLSSLDIPFCLLSAESKPSQSNATG